MKRLVILITIIALPAISIAQKARLDIGLSGLLNRNLNFSFEYKVHEKVTLMSGVGFMIPGKLPWLGISKKLLEDFETEGYLEIALTNMRISAVSVIPEIRYYPKGDALKGFYIGPYARFSDYFYKSSYTSDVDYTDNGQSFTKKEVVFDLTGHLIKVGAGISAGYQLILSDKYSIDFKLFGPGLVYAISSATVDSPEFPSSRGIGEFVEEELSIIPDILGKINVEELSRTSAKGTWHKILPVYRANISIGLVF